ncbi:MAG: thioredoxin family protein [Bryobacterales bacterium]|nr:thioredoxin family protein [Bryobacterales bacterium]
MFTRNSTFPLFLLALTATPALLSAQDEGIPWLDNYKAALQEAKRTRKPIFLEFRCEA